MEKGWPQHGSHYTGWNYLQSPQHHPYTSKITTWNAPETASCPQRHRENQTTCTQEYFLARIEWERVLTNCLKMWHILNECQLQHARISKTSRDLSLNSKFQVNICEVEYLRVSVYIYTLCTCSHNRLASRGQFERRLLENFVKLCSVYMQWVCPLNFSCIFQILCYLTVNNVTVYDIDAMFLIFTSQCVSLYWSITVFLLFVLNGSMAAESENRTRFFLYSGVMSNFYL